MGHCKSSAKGKVHTNTGLPQETRKSQINNLTLHLKQLEKEEMKNPRVSRRKGILKIRAEINAKETKETIEKINKTKSWFFETINKIVKDPPANAGATRDPGPTTGSGRPGEGSMCT